MAAEKLDLLILKTLALGPLHGYGIGQRIEQVSGRGLPRHPGLALPGPPAPRTAPASSTPSGAAPRTTGGRATTRSPAAGRRRLAVEEREWERVAAAVTRVLKAT